MQLLRQTGASGVPDNHGLWLWVPDRRSLRSLVRDDGGVWRMTETRSSNMFDPIEDRGGAAQPLLQVSGLTKHFPVRGGLLSAAKTVRAVDDVSFSVMKGQTA